MAFFFSRWKGEYIWQEKKKAQMPDGQGEERNLQKKQIRKKSLQTIS